MCNSHVYLTHYDVKHGNDLQAALYVWLYWL